MWSPNVREPLAKMLCHQHPLQSLAIDPQGRYVEASVSLKDQLSKFIYLFFHLYDC
jgi:hypothetical protein